MSDIVPLIFSQEQAQIKEELNGKDLSVIFDGTTRLGEAMAIMSGLSALTGKFSSDLFVFS